MRYPRVEILAQIGILSWQMWSGNLLIFEKTKPFQSYMQLTRTKGKSQQWTRKFQEPSVLKAQGRKNYTPTNPN